MAHPIGSIGLGMVSSGSELGKFIRVRRIKLGLTQVGAAKPGGISQGEWSGMETGKRRRLSAKYIAVFSEVLQCEPSQLEALNPEKKQAELKTELGKFIRARREELGLTKTDLARELKVNSSYVNQLELHERYIIYQTARRLVIVLRLEPQALLKFITNQNAKAAGSGLGKLIRTRRRELLLSQSDLAKELGVSKAYVSLIELGALHLNQSDYLLERLAEILKLDVVMLKSLRPKRKANKVKEEIRQSALGKFLTTRRLKLGLSQREVEKRAGLPAQSVHRVEADKSASAKLFCKVAEALGCKISLAQ